MKDIAFIELSSEFINQLNFTKDLGFWETKGIEIISLVSTKEKPYFGKRSYRLGIEEWEMIEGYEFLAKSFLIKSAMWHMNDRYSLSENKLKAILIREYGIKNQ